MKVHYFGTETNNLTTGGQKYMEEIIRYLSNRASISYVVPDKECFLKGVKYRLKFGAIKSFFKANLWAIKKLMNIKNNEIIITNSYYRHILISFITLACVFKNCTIITFVNAIYYYSRDNKWLNFIDRILVFLFLSSSSLIIANSKSTRNELIKLGIKGSKIKVIYPRLDLPDETYVAMRSENKDRLDILFVGYCDPVKELDVLIKAVGLCKHLSFMLHIVGANTVHLEYTEKLKSLIRQYGIDDRVIFHGRLEGKELVKMYALADIFISPGSGEGYGRVLIEAMYYGLPVIGANRCASQELIDEGVNGFLFNPGDFNDLKNKICLLYGDKRLRKSMGIEGEKKSAMANFSKNIGEQFCEIITAEGLLLNNRKEI